MEYNWGEMHKDATTALEGEFPLVIVSAEAAKTSTGDKDMIKYKAKIESGPYVDRPLWGQFVISPESPVAMRILFSHLGVLGLDDKFFAANPTAPVAVIAKALEGRRAIGVIGSREWMGAKREEIQSWKPALGGPGGSSSLGTLGGFNGSSVGSSGIPAGVPSSPSTPATETSASVPAPDAEQPSTPAPNLPF
jgi:hypothetical protein